MKAVSYKKEKSVEGIKKRRGNQAMATSDSLRPASDFPRFCPSCGCERYVRSPRIVQTVFISGLVPVAQAPVEQNEIREAIPYCTRCGFRWESITDPATALTQRLGKMSEFDLLIIVKILYPMFHNLVTAATTKTGLSMGHVQRVLDGERKSADVDKAVVDEFRNRLLSAKIGNII